MIPRRYVINIYIIYIPIQYLTEQQTNKRTTKTYATFSTNPSSKVVQKLFLIGYYGARAIVNFIHIYGFAVVSEPPMDYGDVHAYAVIAWYMTHHLFLLDSEFISIQSTRISNDIWWHWWWWWQLLNQLVYSLASH